MPRLLMEDLISRLGQDPEALSSLQLRKYCILIDWAIVLAKNIESTPYFKSDEFSEAEYIKLMDGLVAAVKTNKFDDLENQDPDDDMDDMLEELKKCLEESTQLTLQIPNDTWYSRSYNELIKKHGFVHTNLKPTFNSKVDSVRSATIELCKLYARFEKEKVFSEPRTEFFTIADQSDGNVTVLDIDKLKVKSEVSKRHAPELALFFLDVMLALQDIQRSQNVKVSEQSMIELIQYLKVLIGQFEPEQKVEVIIAAEALRRSLLAVLPVDKRDKLHPKIAGLLGKLMMGHPNLRDFKTLSEVSNSEQPIDRIIVLSDNDLVDAEVLNSLEMLLKNHHSENMVVTFDYKDVEKVDQHNQSLNKKYTLQVIGHGSVKTEEDKSIKQINANLGSYRGSAESGGKRLAEVVNKCQYIEHVRISGCFTGMIREDANLQALREKYRDSTSVNRRTLTLVTDTDLNMNNSPFESATVAVSCWNNIHKQERDISVTVSPGIIEPDREVGRMTWKGPERKNKAHESIKEVRITTSRGPKNKEKLRLK